MTTTIGFAYLGLIALMGLITFACYGWDKRAARLQHPRIAENRLHLLALGGGWLGALIGRSYFRHKTQKTKFTIITWAIAGLHIALLASFAMDWMI